MVTRSSPTALCRFLRSPNEGEGCDNRNIESVISQYWVNGNCRLKRCAAGKILLKCIYVMNGDQQIVSATSVIVDRVIINGVD